MILLPCSGDACVQTSSPSRPASPAGGHAGVLRRGTHHHHHHDLATPVHMEGSSEEAVCSLGNKVKSRTIGRSRENGWAYLNNRNFYRMHTNAARGYRDTNTFYGNEQQYILSHTISRRLSYTLAASRASHDTAQSTMAWRSGGERGSPRSRRRRQHTGQHSIPQWYTDRLMPEMIRIKTDRIVSLGHHHTSPTTSSERIPQTQTTRQTLDPIYP